MGTVYLIHFDRPYHHARHYIGYTEDVDARLARHHAGNGAKLLAAVRRAGIGYEMVRTWEGVGRDFERKLKNQKNAPRLCPVCKARKRKKGV
jgi:predicted GIY-YIG superfamily endonuclease